MRIATAALVLIAWTSIASAQQAAPNPAASRTMVSAADVAAMMAKAKTRRDQGQSLKEVLAANLTAAYDATTQGDTQQSKDRFITEAYDEVKDFPPVVDGKRTMPRRP